MKRITYGALALACIALLSSGCAKESKADPAAEAPPKVADQVEHVGETGSVKVDKPDQFPVITARVTRPVRN